MANEKKVTMISVCPKDILRHTFNLEKNKKIILQNSPNYHPEIIKVIKEFIADNVGYDDLPIAALSRCNKSGVSLHEINNINISDFIPANSKTSVLCEIKMPEDMFVSVGYQELLEASAELSNLVEPFEIEMAKEHFRDKISVGMGPEVEDESTIISFLPFLDLTACNSFGVLDPELKSESFTKEGWKTIHITELSAFIN